MKGKQYLTRSEQFAVVYREGRSWADKLVVMKALPNKFTWSRYGFSVSRRVGGAVIRNRAKRRLREILRATPVKPGWDIIFIARPPAGTGRYAEINKSVVELLCRAQLLAENYEEICLSAN